MSKSKEAAAASAVLEYLKKQNRPYSATDVFSNLHKEYGKTAVTRVLEELAQKGKIKEKVYGKQKVYCADQSVFPEVKDTDMKAMDQQVVELTDKVRNTQAACKGREAELRDLTSSITTQEAKAQLAEFTKKCCQYQEKLDKLKSGGKTITKEEKEKVYKEHEAMVKQWRKRKRMATEMLDAILEGYPKRKKDLFEEIGIETDEECKVKMPQS
ncbi:homologous-pairing protein 2 homolog [Branchiostoma lanceolatum]|uniref:homologous-pairing protein 2 homolog n=1 Tax=Branchiostoma lanceolatum TaxID=7740 RepID=UPI003456C76D